MRQFILFLLIFSLLPISAMAEAEPQLEWGSFGGVGVSSDSGDQLYQAHLQQMNESAYVQKWGTQYNFTQMTAFVATASLDEIITFLGDLEALWQMNFLTDDVPYSTFYRTLVLGETIETSGDYDYFYWDYSDPIDASVWYQDFSEQSNFKDAREYVIGWTVYLCSNTYFFENNKQGMSVVNRNLEPVWDFELSQHFADLGNAILERLASLYSDTTSIL